MRAMLALTTRYHPHARPLFQCDERWLYPLLKLGDYLCRCPYAPSELHIYDPVSGRAAALLVAFFGIQSLSTDILSCMAIEIYERYGIRYRAKQIVPAINCKSERMMARVSHVDVAYTIIISLATISQNRYDSIYGK